MPNLVGFSEAFSPDQIRSYLKNEVIFHEGDKGSEAYLILKGHVKISTGYYAKKMSITQRQTKVVQVLAIIPSGEIFGEMAILNDMPRSATATAVENTEVIVLNQSDFFHAVERYPKFAIQILKMLSDRVRTMDKKLVDAMALAIMG